MSIVYPVVLAFRAGKGCRQYPFHTVEQFEAWAARYPYRNEWLTLKPIKDREFLPDVMLPPGAGGEGAAYLRGVLA